MKSFFSGYIKNNQPNKAIDLFNKVPKPDEILVNLLFNACAQVGSAEVLVLIKKVCSEIPKSFYLNSRLLTSLLDALIKCGDIKHAQLLFEESKEKFVSIYGAMMNGNKRSTIKYTCSYFFL